MGKGATAKVKLATAAGNRYVIKVFDYSNPDTKKLLHDNFETEIETLKQLAHNNVVNIVDYSLDAVWTKSDGR